MPTKKAKIVYIAIFLLFTLALFTACGIRGSHFETDAPTIRITSYTGFADPDSAIAWVESGYDVAFQQEIFWSAESRHGIIKGYAYRVSYEDSFGVRKYISTPGNDFIDEDGSVTPDVLRHLGNGWVIHYIKGTQDTTPLDNPEAQRTIWTDAVKTTINFPSHDGSGEGGQFGKPEYRSSMFEVVAIDNFGKISNIATKHFYTNSVESKFYISSSRGAFEFSSNNPVGTGIRLQFVFDSKRIGVVPTKDWYYMYRIYKREIGTDRIFEVIDPDDPSTWLEFDSPEGITWFSTINEPNVREKVITKYTRDGPKLASDWQEGSLKTYSVLEAKMIDLAGVVTELRDEETGEVIVERFYITDRYKPAAVFYMTHTYVLGDYHFVPNYSDMIDNKDILPSQTSPTGIRFSTPFVATPVFSDSIYFQRPNFKDTIASMKWSIVGNEQTNFWFRWGYRGEYETENPNNKLDKKVLDSATGDDYKSEIAFFYLQLDGQRYNFQPLLEPRAQENLLQDDPLWLKVPANHEIAQKLYLKNFSSGHHSLKIKVEDLQGAFSEEAALNFELVPLNAPANRQGVLYINNNLTYTDNVLIPLKDFYNDVLPDTPITFINRADLRDNWFLGFDTDVNPYRNRDIRNENYLLSFSLLQQYKYVFYAYESYHNTHRVSSLLEDIEGLRLYIENGGNVVIVGNQQLKPIHELFDAQNPFFLEFYFGFPSYKIDDVEQSDRPVNNNMPNRRYYFKGANPQVSSYPYLKAETTNPPDINQSYAGSIITRNGLQSLTFFRSLDDNATPLYLFDCKEVGEDSYSPTATDPRENYHNKVVGFRRDLGQSTNYVIGVPLFHLERNDVRTLLNSLMQ